MEIGGEIPEDIEYVPTMWGSGSVDDGWTSAAKKALKDGSTRILRFNEPDMSSQADMSASDAATYYKNTDEGLDWLDSFLDDCNDCSVSAIAIHWYGGSVSDVKTFVNEAIDLASGYSISEVWLTEFGLSSDEDGISDLSTTAIFLKEASKWLDEQSEVTRYAFFYYAND
ncbi:hypothetical protein N7493_001751 [Penicillium malachiteum]|uniref:Asl1-like glycosyl hydrolase catalytic domain-containing protein n=1 Tax=Penicillium malachiteum TaxID=1324776 RepID=A0AAD6HV00_9EURO|nr:hypothetical protein N7493_001751 [Penicillium malachiteum]